jgi:aminotransferase in exopolysaccharide biosynthesis
MTDLVKFIQDLYGTNDTIPLHAPQFFEQDEKRVLECIRGTFVSTVGEHVTEFERALCELTSSAFCIATNTGTAALHMALSSVGVTQNDYVLTQSLTFVATCNAISYLGAEPVFIDVDPNTLGMSDTKLESYLEEYACMNDSGVCVDKISGRVIRAVVPMHTFGHPVEIDRIKAICERWNLKLVEDAAEALGSRYKGQPLGTFGDSAALSFNGNKIVTTGGGGAVLSQSESFTKHVKHLSTTARVVDGYEFTHDQIGYNYRLPNLNAALGLAQLERLSYYIDLKRALAKQYQAYFRDSSYRFVVEPKGAHSNYWLNAIECESRTERDYLLEQLNKNGIMARPVWKPMHQLQMYQDSKYQSLERTDYFYHRLINLPSSPIFRN